MKKYALLVLKDLTFRRFDHLDELKDAITACRARNILYRAFKWSAGVETYIELDVVE